MADIEGIRTIVRTCSNLRQIP